MTRLRRFFAGVGDCLDGDKIVLYGEFAHISRVLRMKAGDRLIVCFNDGRDCECEIESFDKDCVRLKILSVSCCAAENDVGVTLFQGLIKGERMDWCLQKAVELGADEIRPFVGRNTRPSGSTATSPRRISKKSNGSTELQRKPLSSAAELSSRRLRKLSVCVSCRVFSEISTLCCCATSMKAKRRFPTRSTGVCS